MQMENLLKHRLNSDKAQKKQNASKYGGER